MPRQVDHEQRRRHIADAVRKVATRRGLAQLSFRTVAAEADVSVSLVQHYFGTKEQLLIDSLDIQSTDLAAVIAERLAELPADAPPLEYVRTIACSFIPTDEPTRNAMAVYLGFAGAAITDPALRRAEAFTNAHNLRAVLASHLEAAREGGGVGASADTATQALAILSLVLGLSLGVLLDQTGPNEALTVLDEHLRLLGDVA